jgi:hypothetical protein
MEEKEVEKRRGGFLYRRIERREIEFEIQDSNCCRAGKKNSHAF